MLAPMTKPEDLLRLIDSGEDTPAIKELEAEAAKLEYLAQKWRDAAEMLRSVSRKGRNYLGWKPKAAVKDWLQKHPGKHLWEEVRNALEREGLSSDKPKRGSAGIRTAMTEAVTSGEIMEDEKTGEIWFPGTAKP